MENSNAIKILESFLSEDKEIKALVGITIEETLHKLREVLPAITPKKLCNFVGQGKLMPCIRYEGILDKYYYEDPHIMYIGLDGGVELDDIDYTEPEPIRTSSLQYKGWITPQDKNLLAKLLMHQEPQFFVKFNMYMAESSCRIIDGPVENYPQFYMDHSNFIKEFENHPARRFSHVAFKENIAYGYFDKIKGVELETSDFMFLEKEVSDLLEALNSKILCSENQLKLNQSYPSCEKIKYILSEVDNPNCAMINHLIVLGVLINFILDKAEVSPNYKSNIKSFELKKELYTEIQNKVGVTGISESSLDKASGSASKVYKDIEPNIPKEIGLKGLKKIIHKMANYVIEHTVIHVERKELCINNEQDLTAILIKYYNEKLLDQHEFLNNLFKGQHL